MCRDLTDHVFSWRSLTCLTSFDKVQGVFRERSTQEAHVQNANFCNSPPSQPTQRGLRSNWPGSANKTGPYDRLRPATVTEDPFSMHHGTVSTTNGGGIPLGGVWGESCDDIKKSRPRKVSSEEVISMPTRATVRPQGSPPPAGESCSMNVGVVDLDSPCPLSGSRWMYALGQGAGSFPLQRTVTILVALRNFMG